MELSKEDALAIMADRAAEVGMLPDRFESCVRGYLDTLDEVYDEYAFNRVVEWHWEDFWKVVAVAYDAPRALKRKGNMFTNEEYNYDDGCRGC